MHSAALEAIANALNGKKQGSGIICHCPVHEDTKPSCSINEENGKLLVYCHATCSQTDVINALKSKNLWPQQVKLSNWNQNSNVYYDYESENGELIYQAIRAKTENGKKKFAFRRPNGSGGFIGNLEGVERVIYKLPEVLEAIANKKEIFIVEGEKDVESLRKIGLVATTNSGGASKWLPSYSPIFIDAKVIIIPDNDDAGRKHVFKVLETLPNFTQDIKVLELPNIKIKEDVSDYIEAFGSNKLLNLVKEVPIPYAQYLNKHKGVAVENFDIEFDDASEEVLAQVFQKYSNGNFKNILGCGIVSWNGHKWHESHKEEVIQKLRSFLVKQFQSSENLPAQIKKMLSFKTYKNVVDVFLTNENVLTLNDKFDKNLWLLNTPTQTIDLQSGVSKDNDKNDLISNSTSVSPIKGEMPGWTQFLIEITGNDCELILFLKRLSGYILSGDPSEEILIFFYGSGGNGKGTFLNTLQTILGDYSTTSDANTFIASNNDRHPTELAKLAGKRLVVSQEISAGKRWDDSKIKSCTGRDEMTARKMRQDYFTFKPQFQLVIASNNKPQFNLVDDSIRRRLVLVPFDQKFLGSKTDKNLKVKLLNEAPAILNWMIEGCLEWQRDGLGIPKKVRLATDEYLQNEDLIQLWLNDNCALSDEVRTTSTALYDNFKTFVSKENRTPLQKSVFYDELEKKGFPKERDSKERFIKKIYLK